jgi:hypothetical protein
MVRYKQTLSPRDVLEKLLNTEVMGVTAREMIGVSHDLSTALVDLIRVHKQAHHMQECLTHGSLLKFL